MPNLSTYEVDTYEVYDMCYGTSPPQATRPFRGSREEADREGMRGRARSLTTQPLKKSTKSNTSTHLYRGNSLSSLITYVQDESFHCPQHPSLLTIVSVWWCSGYTIYTLIGSSRPEPPRFVSLFLRWLFPPFL